MAIDYIELSMELIGVVLLSVFGFYAFMLLATFRKGLLENGWRNVTRGAIILALAQIPLLASRFTFETFLGYVGDFIRFVGIVFLILGVRAQYKVWKLDEKELPPLIEAKN